MRVDFVLLALCYVSSFDSYHTQHSSWTASFLYLDPTSPHSSQIYHDLTRLIFVRYIGDTQDYYHLMIASVSVISV